MPAARAGADRGHADRTLRHASRVIQMLCHSCTACEGFPVDFAEVSRLIARGAPIDYQGSGGGTPLHEACVAYDHRVMMLLIRHKANLNITDTSGNTPLAYAARECHLRAVRNLVWSLCDLKIRNNEGKTAAEMAKEGPWWASGSGRDEFHDALAEYLTNEAPREQVRSICRARAATVPASVAIMAARAMRYFVPQLRARHGAYLVL